MWPTPLWLPSWSHPGRGHVCGTEFCQGVALKAFQEIPILFPFILCGFCSSSSRHHCHLLLCLCGLWLQCHHRHCLGWRWHGHFPCTASSWPGAGEGGCYMVRSNPHVPQILWNTATSTQLPTSPLLEEWALSLWTTLVLKVQIRQLYLLEKSEKWALTLK